MKRKRYIFFIVFALVVLAGVIIFVPADTIGAKYQKELKSIDKVTFKDQRRGAPVIFSDKEKIQKIISFISNYKIALTLPETKIGWLYDIAFFKDNNATIDMCYSGKLTINGVAYRVTNSYNQEEFDNFMQSLIND